MRYLLFIIALVIFSCQTTNGQSINTTFGKNRVQFHDDFKKWDKYETENFITYWYGKAKKVAQATIQLSEFDHDEIQRILEHKVNQKLEIVVYTDLTDQKQTNIGNEDAFHSVDNQTTVVGNKMFVYFDGNHHNLRKQIREGIATIYLNNILFGSNLQEQVQNAILLKLPDWFKKGLVAYCGSFWNSEQEDKLKDIMQLRPSKYTNFDKLAQDYPEIAGHAMWNYLDITYGKSNIANVIYLVRINRNLDESFYYILGTNLENIKENWSTYYSNYFKVDLNSKGYTPDNSALNIKNKRNSPFTSLKLSPDGKNLIYVLNDKGKYKAYVKNLQDNSQKKLFQFGTKNIFQETDYNYPLICWHPTRGEVTIIYEKRDVLYLRMYFLSDWSYEETELTGDLQRIYNVSYLSDGNFLLNASVDGYSDLFAFSIKGRSNKRITNDFYDDLDAIVSNYDGEKGILFSSNRTNTSLEPAELDSILPIEKFDLFFLPLGEGKSLKRITKTPNVSERAPRVLKDDKIYFTTDLGGTMNRYILDDGQMLRTTDLKRNIRVDDLSGDGSKYAYTQVNNGKNQVFISNLSESNDGYTLIDVNTEKSDPDIVSPLLPEEELIKDEYKFQSEFEDPEVLDKINEDTERATIGFEKYFNNYFSENVQDGKKVLKFVSWRANAARLRFRWFDITTRVDNSVLFEGLESYTDSDPNLSGQPTGILFKTDIKDIFEDYEIETGVRIPTSFNGSEFFLTLENNKKLFDHKYGVYRRSRTSVDQSDFFPITRFRRNSTLGLYRIKYPFDIYRSVSLTGTLRFDKFFFLSSDVPTLNSAFDREKRFSLKAEYIFDNSFEHDINILNGVRYKVFIEAINQFDLNFEDGFDFNLSNGFTGIIGFDARYYQPIMRHAVLALRGAGAASFGGKKMLYYIGGVEGSLARRFDNTIPVPPDDFAYKALAPHLRGFDPNIRNGTNFMVSNIELRVPIIKLMGLKNLKYSFFRNFQVVGFFDAGLAWHGRSPFEANNPINSLTLESGSSIIVDVEYFRDPIVMGYGVGVRSTILGYFLKFDVGYGIETREVQPRKFYFSIGKDF